MNQEVDSKNQETDKGKASSPSEEPPKSKSDVIIIGAGAAGLTAGYDLKRQGITVTVLEAHPHCIGGRLRKLESFVDFPIDAGAEWVHRHPRKILPMILDDPSRDISHIIQNTRFNEFAPFYEFRNHKWFISDLEGDDPDFCFVRYTWWDFFDQYIADSIRSDIHYGSVVSHIDYSSADDDDNDNDNAPITVTCQNGQIFQGDQVIVTVPLSILKDGDIQFHPPLPEAKQLALQNIPYEPGLKLFIEFRERFYHNAFVINDNPRIRGQMYYYDLGHLQQSSRNILAIFVYGEKARKYLEMGNDDQAILQRFLADLDQAYGGKASQTYVQHHILNWTLAEPYIRGFYSSYRKGLRFMKELGTPLPRKNDNQPCVFFAGEALPPNGASYGYVHGAALSGRAAAKAVLCTREGRKPPTNWHASMIHCIATLCCGFEHWLFFHDVN